MKLPPITYNGDDAPKPSEQPNGGIRFTYNQVVGIDTLGAFYALDDIFYYPDREDIFQGATGTNFYPVTEDYINDQLDELRDYDYSPLAHIYDEKQTPEGWDEWIEDAIGYDGWDLVLDSSAWLYDDLVIEMSKKASIPEVPDGVVTTDCTGGGRCFGNTLPTFKYVFRPDLLRYIQEVENQDTVLGALSKY